jgi:hypothetical protein
MSQWGSINPDRRHIQEPENDEQEDEQSSNEGWSGGFRDRCTICDEAARCHRHHISYEPERTRIVCNHCHYKIHKVDGFYDHINPLSETSQPEPSVSFPNRGKLYDIPQDVPGAPD